MDLFPEIDVTKRLETSNWVNWRSPHHDGLAGAFPVWIERDWYTQNDLSPLKYGQDLAPPKKKKVHPNPHPPPPPGGGSNTRLWGPICETSPPNDITLGVCLVKRKWVHMPACSSSWSHCSGSYYIKTQRKFTDFQNLKAGLDSHLEFCSTMTDWLQQQQ